MNFWAPSKQGISWLAEDMLALQEGLFRGVGLFIKYPLISSWFLLTFYIEFPVGFCSLLVDTLPLRILAVGWWRWVLGCEVTRSRQVTLCCKVHSKAWRERMWIPGGGTLRSTDWIPVDCDPVTSSIRRCKCKLLFFSFLRVFVVYMGGLFQAWLVTNPSVH